MSKVPGNKIIDEILNGNEKVLTTVYKNVYKQMEHFGLYMNVPLANVKESVQDAFEIFYRQLLDKNNNLNCSVETYIVSIAKKVLMRNEEKWNMNNESISVETIQELKDEAYINLNEKEEQEIKDRIFKELYYSLDQESKQIISLTFEGYNSIEISGKLNLHSESYVRKRRYEIKKYFIEKIKSNPDYEKLRHSNPEDY